MSLLPSLGGLRDSIPTCTCYHLDLFLRNPGKEVAKQFIVEHDQLIHEFEKLTTDLDGLLGVLEDTLHEYGSEANFEAKRLLCALFQVCKAFLEYQLPLHESFPCSTAFIKLHSQLVTQL